MHLLVSFISNVVVYYILLLSDKLSCFDYVYVNIYTIYTVYNLVQITPDFRKLFDPATCSASSIYDLVKFIIKE